MSWEKQPVLGYASKSEAAWGLRQQGFKQREIAEQLGVKLSSIAGLIHYGQTAAGETKSTLHSARLTRGQRDRLVGEARRRGMTLKQLTTAVLGAVADDRLFAAVLDTGDEQ